jgi:hypothetical protein
LAREIKKPPCGYTAANQTTAGGGERKNLTPAKERELNNNMKIKLKQGQKKQIKSIMKAAKAVMTESYKSTNNKLETWQQDVFYAEMEHMIVRSMYTAKLSTDKPKPLPSLRRNNNTVVTVQTPSLKLQQGQYVLHPSIIDEEKVMISTTGDAAHLVRRLRGTQGNYSLELMWHLIDQAEELGYRAPKQTVLNALHRCALTDDCVLCSRREGKHTLYKMEPRSVVEDRLAKEMLKKPCAEKLFRVGLRAARTVTSQYIPYTAVLLRQLTDNVVASK